MIFFFHGGKNIFIIEIYLCHKYREERIKIGRIEKKMTRTLRNAAEIVSTTVLKTSCFAMESCLEFKSTKLSSYMV